MRRGLDFIRRVLAGWRPDADAVAVEDIALVGSELLANAADHAGGPTALDLRHDPNTGLLRIAATDTSPAAPRLRPVRPDQPHDRGMHIIARLAIAWGAGRTV
ncbi:ATP-binding protein [Kitasatospora sp. NPDC085895]|uniref:ATP-binding protein n=1 Tax=Kitasatospora sp. NPDC085895 TaxID=3155057 RepID=UPI00344E9700